MRKTRGMAIGALALAGTFAVGAAHAGNVSWSVTIGAPAIALPLPPLPVPVVPVPVFHRAPVVLPAPVYGPGYAPRYPREHRPGYRVAYRQPTRWDRDGDGVPNRYDRRYNPAWDRDGDGIANRRDPYDNRGGDHWRHR